MNPPLQRGESCRRNDENRFNGLLRMVKTVETVSPAAAPPITPLKRGVNARLFLQCFRG
jgi:hypothetical protein